MTIRYYARVSTTEQADEGYSIAAQTRMANLYAEMHYPNQRIIAYVDEGISGKTGDRPAFIRLNNEVMKGDVVIVHKLDRFARNVQLLLSTLEDYNRKGIRFVSISEQIDFGTSIGRVMLTLLAAFAQYYVDNLSEETAKGLKEKAQKGYWVGAVPIGYRKANGSTAILELSEDAPIVREIFRLYTQEGLSINQIAQELNRQGYTAYNWRDKQRSPWGRENVRVVLRNRAYMGKVTSGGVEFDGTHPPIITPEIFAAAARKRQENDTRYLVSGQHR